MYSMIFYFISKLHIFCMMVVGQFCKGQKITKCNKCKKKKTFHITKSTSSAVPEIWGQECMQIFSPTSAVIFGESNLKVMQVLFNT